MTKPEGIIIVIGPGQTREQAIEDYVGAHGTPEMLRPPADPAQPETWYPDALERPEIHYIKSEVPRPKRGGPPPRRLGERDKENPSPERPA